VHLARHSRQRYMPQEGQRVEKRTHSNYQPADETKEAENVTAQPHTWKHTHAASAKRNAVFVPLLFFYNAQMFIKAVIVLCCALQELSCCRGGAIIKLREPDRAGSET
jgi:hypothetical protein